MDVYRQASEIMRIVRDGRGTAKALCLRKDMQKKKQTYAVVCETLRYYEVLEDVLRQAQFFEYYPRASKDLAMVLAYDTVVGRGVKTRNDSTAVAIEKSGPYLREAYERVKKHHIIQPRASVTEDFNEDDADGSVKAPRVAAFPRYARVNTLKIAEEELKERLLRPKRDRDGDDGRGTCGRATGRTFPSFVVDDHIPNLWVFPHGTDLHSHPSVRSGQLILQDKSSCLPAGVLLGAVPVEVSYMHPLGTSRKEQPVEYAIDACAAPGNKTTQLAALGAQSGIKILAVERDPKRAGLLQQRVTSLGAAEIVNVVNDDFFDLRSDVRDAAEAILLDPSCSASGVVSRVDVALEYQRAKKPTEQQRGEDYDDDAERDDGNETSNRKKETRVDVLARVQRKLLTHALLSFDNCHRVVYSTCSIHTQENEDVVRAVLSDERIQKRGWQLSNIMPAWTSRGLTTTSDDAATPSNNAAAINLAFTIRCNPDTDKTNGFYVARFDRKLQSKSKKTMASGAPTDEEAGTASSSTGLEGLDACDKADESTGDANCAEATTSVNSKAATPAPKTTPALTGPPKTLVFASDSDDD